MKKSKHLQKYYELMQVWNLLTSDGFYDLAQRTLIVASEFASAYHLTDEEIRTGIVIEVQS